MLKLILPLLILFASAAPAFAAPSPPPQVQPDPRLAAKDQQIAQLQQQVSDLTSANEKITALARGYRKELADIMDREALQLGAYAPVDGPPPQQPAK